MKKKWFGIRIGLLLGAALGWWGLLYPELALTPDTVRVVRDESVDEASSTSEDWRFGSHLYWDILNAGSGKVTFRSKLLSDFNIILEAFYGRNK